MEEKIGIKRCNFCGEQPVFTPFTWGEVKVQCVCQDNKFGYLRFANMKNAVKGWNYRQEKLKNQPSLFNHD